MARDAAHQSLLRQQANEREKFEKDYPAMRPMHAGQSAPSRDMIKREWEEVVKRLQTDMMRSHQAACAAAHARVSRELMQLQESERIIRLRAEFEEAYCSSRGQFGHEQVLGRLKLAEVQRLLNHQASLEMVSEILEVEGIPQWLSDLLAQGAHEDAANEADEADMAHNVGSSAPPALATSASSEVVASPPSEKVIIHLSHILSRHTGGAQEDLTSVFLEAYCKPAALKELLWSQLNAQQPVQTRRQSEGRYVLEYVCAKPIGTTCVCFEDSGKYSIRETSRLRIVLSQNGKHVISAYPIAAQGCN